MSRKSLIIAGAILIFLALIPGFYFYSQYRKLLNNPNTITQEKVETVVDKVNKLFDLPKNEVPTLATVSNVDKLSNQTFFAKAKNGDKVLVYSQAKRAFLYRPSINKIIEISAVTIPTPSPSPMPKSAKITPVPTAKAAPSPTKPADVTVAIYNGSKIAGLAALYEKQLEDKLTFVSVVEKSNTLKDYSNTMVIDLSGNKKDQAQQIALAVSGEVTASLPSGEKKPEADILIIVGK